jgi:hypothetical protein
MPLFVMLALQSAPAADASPPPKLEAVKPCPPQQPGGEIVVCGHPQAQEQYRLRPIPEKYTESPVRAEKSIAKGMTLSAETEQHVILHVPSNRAMVRLKVKF